jgi:hypothetical protein
MEFGPIFWITAIVLIGAYVVLEIAHGLSRRSATVVRVLENGLPLGGMLGCRVEVEMENGQLVTADASGCAVCQNPMSPGRKVFLVKQRSGWMVTCGAGEKERA